MSHNPTPAASAGPDFEAAERKATSIVENRPIYFLEDEKDRFNLARAYLALRSLPREGEAPAAWGWLDPDRPEVGFRVLTPHGVGHAEELWRHTFAKYGEMAPPGGIIPLYRAAPPLPAGRPEETQREEGDPAVEKHCAWNLGRDGTFVSACGEEWTFEEDVRDDYRYCPKCGRSITHTHVRGSALPAGRGSEVSEALDELAMRLVRESKSLDPEARKVLYEGLWEMMADESRKDAALGRGREGANNA